MSRYLILGESMLKRPDMNLEAHAKSSCFWERVYHRIFG